MASELFFDVIIANGRIKEFYWRSAPERLGCNFKFVVRTEKRIGKKGFFVLFTDWELHILLQDLSAETELIDMIDKQILETKNSSAMGSPRSAESSPMPGSVISPNRSFFKPGVNPDFSKYFNENVLKADYATASRQEQLLQLTKYFRYKEAWLILDKYVSKTRVRLLLFGMAQWVSFVRDDNNEKMLRDRKRWRIHTAANQENDLQAWYHSVFHQEVYRLRGPFWYRDAVLPVYRKSYAIVDTGMTSLEEAAVAHVLCSPDTTYGDVAGHMFVVQAIATEEEYALFQKLVSQGIPITKYPRLGRPAKKHFRISFVEGAVYFTWKGKFGNQGINLGEVNGMVEGLSTDVLRRTGQTNKNEYYTSLVCSGRSVDLCLETVEEKLLWKALLEKLVAKEHGILRNISMEYPELPSNLTDEDNDLAWFVLCNALGSTIITHAIRAHLIKIPLQ
jgi:hypothetical protein